MSVSVEPVEGVVVIRAGGAVLGESRRALRVAVAGAEPVYLIPEADFETAFLEATGEEMTDSRLGAATVFDIIAKSGPIEGAAWRYDAPPEAAAAIRGHLGFDGERAAVELL